MVTITRKFTFEAAHYLPYHLGKCRHIHGHSYKMWVTITGDIQDHDKDFEEKNPECGMIMDFSRLKEVVNGIIRHDGEIVNGLDHNLLNNFYEIPTAETMVLSIAKEIQFALPEGYYLLKLELWETEDAYATWINPNYSKLLELSKR